MSVCAIANAAITDHFSADQFEVAQTGKLQVAILRNGGNREQQKKRPNATREFSSSRIVAQDEDPQDSREPRRHQDRAATAASAGFKRAVKCRRKGAS